MIEVIFEDDDIVVVNKPAGLIVHPAPGHADGSVAGELVKSRPGMAAVGSRERPGVVHRLDIETSGVMVFAKTQRAYLRLRAAFEAHGKVTKTYLAVLHGADLHRGGKADRGHGNARGSHLHGFRRLRFVQAVKSFQKPHKK